MIKPMMQTVEPGKLQQTVHEDCTVVARARVFCASNKRGQAR